MFNKKKQIKTLTVWIILIIIWINLFHFVFLQNGVSFDYLIFDLLLNKVYRQSSNPKIHYLLISNNTYSDLFRSNVIDRDKISEAVILLEKLGVEQIIFDIIFAHPSNPKSDNALAKVFNEYGNIIQPVSLINNQEQICLDKFNDNKIIDIQPHLKYSHPDQIILPNSKFLPKNMALGHISDNSDNDGVMRHTRLIIKNDSAFIPSLSLASFLMLMNDSINTFRYIENEFILINNKIRVPVDHLGRTIVPFFAKWGEDFDAITLEYFMELAGDDSENMKLRNSFNGKIVVISDISAGAADIYPTPISKLTPLVMLHASMLNALLNNKFISQIRLSDRIIILNFLLFVLFSLFFKQKRYYFLLSFLCSIGFLSLLTIILFMQGHFLFFISILISLTISFTLGFLLIEYISMNEKKIIELDNYRKSFEMLETKKILMNLLPKNQFSFKDYEISAYISSAEEVGGDFFDYYQVNGELKIFLADGSGHGLQAGLLIVSLKTILNSMELYNPSQTLFKINNILKEIHFSKLFLCLSMISIREENISFSVAGLPPIIHYKAKSNELCSYHHKNIPLGIKHDFQFIESSIELGKNDILFVYTDGLNELFNAKKEMLGFERIKETILKCSSKTINNIVSELEDLINNWKKNTLQNDDITFLVLKKNKTLLNSQTLLKFKI